VSGRNQGSYSIELEKQIASQKGASQLHDGAGDRRRMIQVLDLTPLTAAVLGAVALAHLGSPIVGLLFYLPPLGTYAYVETRSGE